MGAEGSTPSQKPQDEATPSSTPTHAPDSSHTPTQILESGCTVPTATSVGDETPKVQINIDSTPEIIAASTSKTTESSTTPGDSSAVGKREELGRISDTSTAKSGK